MAYSFGSRVLRALLFVTIFSSLAAGVSAVEYRVMTWNVEDMDLFDGAGLERVPWQLEAEEALAQAIRDIEPDILLLVEAPSFIELQAFNERWNLDYHIVHVRQQSGRRAYADSMALLTLKPVTRAELLTPPVPGSTRSAGSAYLDWSYRGLLVAEYEGVTIIGVHLKSPWDGKQRSYDIRTAQAFGILDFIGNLEGDLIVLGDFNDSPGRDGKELSYGVPDTLHLLESELLRSPGNEITQEKGFNLDHIFVRGGEIGPRRIEDTDWSLSDHRPVWTIIGF